MLITALVFAALAALVHVYIFWLEALAFRTVGRKVFGAPADQVDAMAPWAYNQGFYNLFLAIGTIAGIGVTGGGNHDAGLALVTFGTGSMLTAALVLIGSDRSKLRAAVVQGLFPALCLLSLLVYVAS